MGAQTWDDVKGEVKAFCIAAIFTGACLACIGAMIWPEIVLAAFGL